MQQRRTSSVSIIKRSGALGIVGSVLVGSMLLVPLVAAHADTETCDPDARTPFRIAGQTETAENANNVEHGTPTSAYARTGERLSPDIRDWDFDGVNPVEFTWYRDGNAIATRTGDKPNYTVTAADQGHKLTLGAKVEYSDGDVTIRTCTAVNSKIVATNPTTTTLSVKPAEIPYGKGKAVHYTVHVKTADGTAPKGKVQLWYRSVGDNEGDWPGYLFYSKKEGWQTRIGSSGTATATLPANSADGYIFSQLPTNRLVARYLPANASSEQFSDSAGAKFTVKRAKTRTRLKVLKHHIKSGHRLRVLVIVRLPAQIKSKGTVRVTLSGHTVITKKISGKGVVSTKLHSKPITDTGKHKVRAFFSPTSGYQSYSDAYKASRSTVRHLHVRR